MLFNIDYSVCTNLIIQRIKNTKFKLLIVRGVLLLYLFFSVISTGFSQSGKFQLFDFYHNMNGLSQGTVNTMVQDKYGYMWLGTQDGLNRFDGVNFKAYFNDVKDSTSLSDNYISKIIEDDQHNLWIGTWGGLNKYDIHTENFIRYNAGRNSSIKTNLVKITDLVQTMDHKIWIGSNTGVHRLDPITEDFRTYTIPYPDQSIRVINDILEDQNGRLWVGTSNGLYYYNEDKDVFESYSDRMIDDDVLSLWMSDVEELWMGTNGGGLNKLYLKSGDLKTYLHSSGNSAENIVSSILGDGIDQLWLATDGGYVNTFNTKSETFGELNVTYPRVLCLYKDQANDLWVGMRGGLNRVGKDVSLFKQYRNDNNGNLISPSGDIHALATDSKGNIWTGSSTNGVKKLNPNTLEVVNYVHSDGKSISNNNVRFLYIDSDDIVWMATHEGLNRYNPATNKFRHYIPNDDPNSLSNKIVNYIYEDSNHNLWICTNNGISILDKSTDTFEVMRNDPDTNNSLSGHMIANVIEDAEGVFWIGYRNSGMDRYDPKSGAFTHYHTSNSENSLSNGRVTYIHDDHKGNLWISTYGGGLNKFNKESGEFKIYGQEDGLTNTSLYCVLEDDNGDLWMSHNNGISKFEISTEHFSNYFQDVEFNSNAFHQTKEGGILFGSYNIVSFEPSAIIGNETFPSVVINEFMMFNERINQKTNGEILSKNLEETDTIVLRYDQNFFSFSFKSLNFHNSDQNNFKYKLENFDQDWIEAQNHARASYTNVPPGEYLFQVQGSNNNQIWNEVGDAIFIRVIAPWWQTWTFRVLCALFIILALVVFYKLRVKGIKKQKQELEDIVKKRTTQLTLNKQEIKNQNKELIALNDEKSDLIQIVSHDLRSPLNQIKGLASIVKMINPDLNKETIDSIDLINDLVDRQNEMISKILDSNAIDARKINFSVVSVDVNRVIQKVIDSFLVLAIEKDIEIGTDFNSKNPHIESDQSYFIQVVENLLSNALKFSPRNTKISLSTIIQDDFVIISIRDEGPGISQEDMKKLFTRYTKLTAKPTADESSSGLGLSIVKRYVEVMNGQVVCESEVGKGANFIVKLPTSKN